MHLPVDLREEDPRSLHMIFVNGNLVGSLRSEEMLIHKLNSLLVTACMAKVVAELSLCQLVNLMRH